MSYAVGHIVYGIDLQVPSFAGSPLEPFEDDIATLIGEELVQTHYSGNGDEPTYIGADLGTINECKTVIVSALTLVPSEDQKKVFEQKRAELLDFEDVNDSFKAFLRAAEPTVFITWGSS